ncbi:hypothetical protein [Segatella hominis]|uniref:hypothetical protein n=1 Tax=Segatella hominis TaxID=2518605 RepID=UPI003AB0CAA5
METIGMRNILVISLVFLLSMVCHAQKIATSELNGTKWKEISPTYDYCERGMTFTMDTRTTSTKFYKTGKEFNCPLKYYISSSIPETFDSIRIGKSRRGTYIIQFVDNKVFWFKIVELSNTKMTLLSKYGQTIIYQKIK